MRIQGQVIYLEGDAGKQHTGAGRSEAEGERQATQGVLSSKWPLRATGDMGHSAEHASQSSHPKETMAGVSYLSALFGQRHV